MDHSSHVPQQPHVTEDPKAVLNAITTRDVAASAVLPGPDCPQPEVWLRCPPFRSVPGRPRREARPVPVAALDAAAAGATVLRASDAEAAPFHRRLLRGEPGAGVSDHAVSVPVLAPPPSDLAAVLGALDLAPGAVAVAVPADAVAALEEAAGCLAVRPSSMAGATATEELHPAAVAWLCGPDGPGGAGLWPALVVSPHAAPPAARCGRCCWCQLSSVAETERVPPCAASPVPQWEPTAGGGARLLVSSGDEWAAVGPSVLAIPDAVVHVTCPAVPPTPPPPSPETLEAPEPDEEPEPSPATPSEGTVEEDEDALLPPPPEPAALLLAELIAACRAFPCHPSQPAAG